MEWKVTLNKKARKNLKMLPPLVSRKFALLLAELEKLGPIRLNWQNYSGLGKNKYHCHINYNWVDVGEKWKGKLKLGQKEYRLSL